MSAKAHPKIAFIGAGSTVFMKNIVGDILQRPALGGATVALMDIDPRAAGGKRDRRQESSSRRSAFPPGSRRMPTAPRARGRRFRGHGVSDRRLRALHDNGFRGAQALRPQADDRRHAGRSAASCAAFAPFRISGKSARTCSRALSARRSCCNTSTRWRSIPGRSRRGIPQFVRSVSAIPCRARRWSWPTISTFRSRRSAIAPPASITWPSISNSSADGRTAAIATSIPISSTAIERAACPSPTTTIPAAPTGCATKC